MVTLKKTLNSLAALALLASPVALAGINVIDFDKTSRGHDIHNGQIVDNEYLAEWGVTIGSCNYDDNKDPTNHQIKNHKCRSRDTADRQVAFDTMLSHTRDPDLEFNNPHNDYKTSYQALNIGGYTGADNPGNILILQENSHGCGDGICDEPDDEGNRPAGFFEFEFDTLVNIISIDFFDIENAEATNFANRISFYEGDTLKTLGEVPSTGDGDYARTLFNIMSIDRLVINMPGSGGIDNLVFSTGHIDVPAPAALGLLAMGLVTMRLRRKQ